MATTYLFYVDGFAKIGHAMDMDARLLLLLWVAPPLYVPVDVTKGELLCRRDYATKMEAVTAERYCQDILDPYRARKSRRGGRCEWFIIGRDEAVAAFNSVDETEVLTFEMDKATRRKMEKVKRMVGSPSLGEAVRVALRAGMERL